MKIDIPRVLVHLRGRVVRETPGNRVEGAAMRIVARAFASRQRYEAAQRLARRGMGPLAQALPGPLRVWSRARDLPDVPAESFRTWWERERG